MSGHPPGRPSAQRGDLTNGMSAVVHRAPRACTSRAGMAAEQELAGFVVRILHVWLVD